MADAYYFISYEYTPDGKSTIKGNAVISEEPTKVWKRTYARLNENYKYDKFDVDDKFYITFFYEIDEEIYNLSKRHNPNDQDYIQLSAKDAFKELAFMEE